MKRGSKGAKAAGEGKPSQRSSAKGRNPMPPKRIGASTRERKPVSPRVSGGPKMKGSDGSKRGKR